MNNNIDNDDDWGWGNDNIKPIETVKPIDTTETTKPTESTETTEMQKKNKKKFNIEQFKIFFERSANKSKALGEYLKSFIQYKLEEDNDKPGKVYKQINLELPFAKIHLPKGPAMIQWNSWFENVENINNDLYRDVFASFGNKFPRGIKLVSGIALDKRNTVNRFNMSKTNAVATASFQGTLHICLGTNIKPEDIFGEFKN